MRNLSAWDCYEKLYGTNLTEIVRSRFMGNVEVTIGVAYNKVGLLVQRIVPVLPGSCDVILPKGSFVVRCPVNIKGQGIGKTILRSEK